MSLATRYGVVLCAFALFWLASRAIDATRDYSVPPDYVDLAVCERARLNAAKIEAGQSKMDNAAHRWTIGECRQQGFRVE